MKKPVRKPAKAPAPSKGAKATPSAAKRQGPAPKKKPSRPIMSPWVIVRVQGNRENWARQNLEQQGYKVLYLRKEVERQAKLEPVFPGYLFVLIDKGQDTHAIRGTFGVVGLVPSNERVENVPIRVMKLLLKSADAKGIVTLPPKGKLRLNHTYKITHGSFQNFDARYVGLNADKRCELLLSIFGKDVKLALPRDYIE